MKRRQFLKNSGAFAAHLIGSSLVITPALMKMASAQTRLPLQDLQTRLNDQSLMLTPSDSEFAKYQSSFNLRTLLTPQLRVLCKTAQSVAAVLRWAQQNNIPFSIRGGGHSYEGFSQSSSVVIDVRALNQVRVSSDRQSVAVDAGCILHEVYEVLGKQGLMISAGTCPTVGIAGHVQGGGFGLSSRQFGLACDSAIAFQLVSAQGNLIQASASENPELFWALRGGGGGSFGVLTKIIFRTHVLKEVSNCHISWKLPIGSATKLMKAWQEWAPAAPKSLTSYFRVNKADDNLIGIHLGAQSTGPESELKNLFSTWMNPGDADSFRTSTMTFLESTQQFDPDEPAFMKGKSDYVDKPISDEGLRTLLQGLLELSPGLDVLCDAYGGTVGDVATDATAFFHRKALYSMQYSSQWDHSSGSASKISQMRKLYDSLRPYISGGAYVNYCDLDLKDWKQAYWGDNLPRLIAVKQKWDPKNIFNHAQSIPLK